MTEEIKYEIRNEDCLIGLKKIEDESINCCITSPPYFGLRDYQNDKQIGLEETPEAYVEKLVDVFNEVKRVLRDDGTLWLNLGDTYAGHNSRASKGRAGYGEPRECVTKRIFQGIKQKDIIGIPWMVAFALRESGWYLRQDIIWAKENPMPEAVKDRCTKAHEYIFLLSKNKKYYYDAKAIEENAKTKPGVTWAERKASGATAGNVIVGDEKRNGTQRVVHGKGISSNLTRQDGKRNKRSVWNVNVKPFKEAHFATFPTELIEPCVLAGCPENGIILDPFNGAGTTGVVSIVNNRNYLGFEINNDYIEISEKRLKEIQKKVKLPI